VGEDLETDGGSTTNTKATNTSTSKSSKSSSSKENAPSTSEMEPSSSSAGDIPLDDRAKMGANMFLLSGSELGHVMTRLELECPIVLETWDNQKIEINVDAIPPNIFTSLQSYVSEKVGTRIPPAGSQDGGDQVTSKKNKKRKTL
jgi:hypothetical protein